MTTRKTLLSLVFLMFLPSIMHCQVALDWVRVVGGPMGDHGIVITTDKWGNVYSAGFFNDTVDFNPGTGFQLIGVRNNDVYITKYDANGNFIWAQAFGGIGTDQCFGLKTDEIGNIYISGQFGGTVDLNPGGANGELIATGGNDVFVAKYDSSGSLLWAKRMGGMGNDIAYGLDIDASGNVYTTGEYVGTEINRIDFDPGPDTFRLISKGSGDIFVSKLDTDGNFVWAKSMGSNRPDYSYDIAVDKQGNVYTTGVFQDTGDFDPGPNEARVVSNGGYDIFVSKLDSMGNYVWAKGIGAVGADYGYGITVSDSGYVYTTGYFQRTVEFNPGGSNSTILTSLGNPSDLFVTKFKAEDGELVWAKRMGGSLAETGRSIDVDLRDNVYVGGWFNSQNASFNPDSTTGDFASRGGNDLFIVKLNFEGNYQWALSMGGTASDFGYGISVDNSGNVYTTGYVQGTIDFDPGPDTFNVTANTGNYDLYVHKLLCTDTNSVYIEVDICKDDYTYNEVTYNETGNYIQQFTNMSGCDSFFYLNLIIRGEVAEPVINVDGFILSTILPYASYQWFKNGEPIAGATERNYPVTENASYSVVVSNENGCTDTSEIYRVTNYTSISGISLQDEIHVFPNPAQDIVFIQAPIKVSADLFSIEGRKVRSINNVQTISLNGLADGIYILRIKDETGNMLKMEKLTKAR